MSFVIIETCNFGGKNTFIFCDDDVVVGCEKFVRLVRERVESEHFLHVMLSNL